VNTFEVTVSMIPPRGDQSKVKKMVGEKEEPNETTRKKADTGNVIREGASYAMENVQEKAVEMIEGSSMG